MSQSPCSSPTNKLNCLLTEEEIEPYVRRKKSASDSRKKLQGLNDEEQNLLRTSINSRERKRMHDLNDALEELRSVLPYGQEANARKLAKISTIMLATNWIRRLTNENSRLIAEVESLRRSKDPQSTTPSVPFAVAPFVFHCLRQFGQPCSCVSCSTVQSKKEN